MINVFTEVLAFFYTPDTQTYVQSFNPLLLNMYFFRCAPDTKSRGFLLHCAPDRKPYYYYRSLFTFKPAFFFYAPDTEVLRRFAILCSW